MTTETHTHTFTYGGRLYVNGYRIVSWVCVCGAHDDEWELID